MSYVFKIDTDGTVNHTNHSDWTETQNGFNEDRIQSISETTMVTQANAQLLAAKAGASIPSTFSRLYLFDSAFDAINNANIAQDSLYFIIVSHCLDLLELLFHFGNSNDITYKVWNISNRIDTLISRASPPINGVTTKHPHKILGESLNYDLNNNLGTIDKITLIYYKGILMGGTSPLTMVFTSPNLTKEMKGLSINEQPKSTNGRLFFANNYTPLDSRSEQFQQYLFTIKNTLVAPYFSRQIGNILRSVGFVKFINDYFNNRQFSALDIDNNYDSIKLRGYNIQQQLAIFPNNVIPFFSIKHSIIQDNIRESSSFLMQPSIVNLDGEYSPLVLVSNSTQGGKNYYGNVPWNDSIRITKDAIRNIDIRDRILPGSGGIKYPFVITSDFLEDSLVKLPFNINNDYFQTYSDDNSKFLLPIKKIYFKYFTIEDLTNHFSLENSNGTVTAKLIIPTRGGNMIFSKAYNIKIKNDIIGLSLGMAFFPFYRLTNRNKYTIMVAEDDIQFRPEYLKFYKSNPIIPVNYNPPSYRSQKVGGEVPGSLYYQLNDSFEFIEIRVDESTNGIIIPKFIPVDIQQNKTFSFAIDFGTSNTHIACVVHDAGGRPNDPTAFSINETDMQVVMLNKPRDTQMPRFYSAFDHSEIFADLQNMRTLFRREFIPPIVGRNDSIFPQDGNQAALKEQIEGRLLNEPGGEYSPFSFPIRTAIFESVNPANDNNFQLELFKDANLGFNINYEQNYSGYYATNLKWAIEQNPQGNRARVKIFFEVLLHLIKNKVMLNGGNLARTNIRWLAPQSMNDELLRNIKEQIEIASTNVFGNASCFNLEPISESFAPYFYFEKNGRIEVDENAVNIDIGGGTTDIMLYNRNNEYFNISFRFAANDIWGDGIRYGRDGNQLRLRDNGFITNFNSEIDSEEYRIFLSAKSKESSSSEDIINLLFKYNKQLGFINSIGEKPELRIVLFLHYSAIIYHLVQFIEEKDLELPKKLCFTGLGSQYLNLIMERTDDVKEFTLKLFKAYTDKIADPDFSIVFTPIPKETTAYGAAIFASMGNVNMPNIIPSCSIGNLKSESEQFNLEFEQSIIKDAINNENFRKSVLLNIKYFIEKTLDNRDIRSFMGRKNVRNTEIVKTFLLGDDVCNRGRLFDSYNTAVGQMNGEFEIKETFFFLPLKNALYELGKYITTP